MKTTRLFIIGIMLAALWGCEKNSYVFDQNDIIGTWIEKSPDLYDNVSDTIVFSPSGDVKKHFHFANWFFELKNDTVTFSNNDIKRKFSIDVINNDEIIINNFIDRLLTSQVKNIHYIKLK